jgi:hypothetical protein
MYSRRMLPAIAIIRWILGFARTAERPNAMRIMKTSSSATCPVAINGPTRQPRRGAWDTIAAVTGPGDTTAPIEIANANMKIAMGVEVGIFLKHESIDGDSTLK